MPQKMKTIAPREHVSNTEEFFFFVCVCFPPQGHGYPGNTGESESLVYRFDVGVEASQG